MVSITKGDIGLEVLRFISRPNAGFSAIKLTGRNSDNYPPGYHAFARQNVCNAVLSPRKMLRSALRMLATLFGKLPRGSRSHLPSPVYCQRCQSLQGAVFRGSRW